jgi:hypothetical protein
VSDTLTADTSHVWQGHYKRIKELDRRYTEHDRLFRSAMRAGDAGDWDAVRAAWDSYATLRDSNWCMGGDVH